MAFTDENFAKVEAAAAILFGAMGLPEVRYPDGTEIAPQLEMRRDSGSTPACARSGPFHTRRAPRRPPRRAEIDLVILRESTEGLFASRGKGEVIEDDQARDTKVITRATPSGCSTSPSGSPSAAASAARRAG